MRIKELFTQPFKWSWFSQSDEEAIAHFSTGKMDYMVNFIYNESRDPKDRGWIVEFSASMPDGMGITGSGDSAQVFATVIEIIKKFKQSHPKAMLMFSAAEPSRQKLYLSLVKKLSSSYTVDTDFESGTKYYKAL